jgi:hypothetical protein
MGQHVGGVRFLYGRVRWRVRRVWCWKGQDGQLVPPPHRGAGLGRRVGDRISERVSGLAMARLVHGAAFDAVIEV